MPEDAAGARPVRSTWTRPEPPTGTVASEGLWISVRAVKHRIIVRTVAGGARWVARAIDAADLPGVLGTIAGNDSVAVICTSPEDVESLLDQIAGLLESAEGHSSLTDE